MAGSWPAAGHGCGRIGPLGGMMRTWANAPAVASAAHTNHQATTTSTHHDPHAHAATRAGASSSRSQDPEVERKVKFFR